MPVHNAAYRAWNGVRVSEWTRWLTICTTGIRRASQSRWLKRLLFASLFPVLFFTIPFFLFEQAARDPNVWRAFAGFVRNFPQAAELYETIGTSSPTAEQLVELRRSTWSFLLLTMLRYPQASLMVVVVGIVAPPLISQDLRTRAYLIYFARPITRLEYIAGKFGVVAFYLFSISALPALLLYIAGVMLSPSLSVLATTWDLPLRIVVGSICFIVPTTLVALAFSSLTLESRYAGFGWFAMWIMGHVTYSALVAMPTFEAARGNYVYDPGWRLLTSPYQVLGVVQSYIFGFDTDNSMVLPSFVMLGIVSALSTLILFRRVTAPMRV